MSSNEARSTKKVSESPPSKKKSPKSKDEPLPMDFDSTRDGYVRRLTRDTAKGMNRTSLLTGYYGSRGERIRHVVHEGALRLPPEALEIIAADAEPQKFALPGLDSVVRPSRDPELESITVTDVYGIMIPADPSTMRPATLRTYAKNHVVPVVLPTTTSDRDDAERIRGGGGEDDETMQYSPPASSSPTDHASMQQQSAQGEPNTSNRASALTERIFPHALVQPQPPVQTAADPASSASSLASSQPASSPAAQSVTQPLHSPTTATTNTGTINTQPETAISSTASTAPVSAPVSSVASLPLAQPEVIALKKRPSSQWEVHAPSANDEIQTDHFNKTPKPEWYKSDSISELEKTILSEWFDGSAPHRTAQTYLAVREKIIDMSDKLVNRYVTTTMVRRAIPGDAGSLMRLHQFLMTYALINDESSNDSAPTPLALQDNKAMIRWASPIREELMQAVVAESRKRPKIANSAEFVPLDWEAVAEAVGHGTTAKDCERQFLAMPIPEQGSTAERPITPDTAMSDGAKKKEDKSRLASKEKVLQEIVDGSDPDVVSVVTDAALRVTQRNLEKTQKAGILALVASKAVEEARSQEDAVAHLLSEIVDIRMKKLENRLALLDDVEGMLEAERAALELERRDLYTARCRNWFGGP